MRSAITKEKKEEMRSLRQQGYSLPEITKKVNISYGTVYRYIKGVPVQEPYRKIWKGKQGGSVKRMKMKIQEAEEKALDTIRTLSDKEKIIFLAALYWGEGNKKDFNLMNSDPRLIHVFITGLHTVFDIPRERLRISIRLYEDLDRVACLHYWSQVTGIPVEDFVSVDTIKGKKKGKLKYGMCRVRISKGGDMLKYIQSLYKQISMLFEPP